MTQNMNTLNYAVIFVTVDATSEAKKLENNWKL